MPKMFSKFVHNSSAMVISASLVFSSHAMASYSFFSKPSKIVACEITLTGQHLDLSQKQSALPVVRDVIYKVRKAAPKSPRDGISFERLAYNGRIDKLSTGQGEKVLSRLNGIENAITSGNPDMQYFSMEIRGADIEKALASIEARESKIQDSYMKIKEQIQEKYRASMAKRTSGLFLNGLDVFFLGYWLGKLILSVLVEPQLFHGSIMLGNFDVLPMLDVFVLANAADVFRNKVNKYVQHNRYRLDSQYLQLKKTLKEASANAIDSNKLFISSYGMTVPTEFHHLLMEDKKQGSLTDEAISSARELGAIYGELTLWESQRMEWKDFLENRVTQYQANAGDIHRSIYVDHIVYFDTEKNEPVWLSFYRSYRQIPAGRKPTKKIKESVRERSWGWEPGLVPVPTK